MRESRSWGRSKHHKLSYTCGGADPFFYREGSCSVVKGSHGRLHIPSWNVERRWVLSLTSPTRNVLGRFLGRSRSKSTAERCGEVRSQTQDAADANRGVEIAVELVCSGSIAVLLQPEMHLRLSRPASASHIVGSPRHFRRLRLRPIEAVVPACNGMMATTRY